MLDVKDKSYHLPTGDPMKNWLENVVGAASPGNGIIIGELELELMQMGGIMAMLLSYQCVLRKSISPGVSSGASVPTVMGQLAQT
jgi:hypothetical protein